jgi:hypothetical protein
LSRRNNRFLVIHIDRYSTTFLKSCHFIQRYFRLLFRGSISYLITRFKRESVFSTRQIKRLGHWLVSLPHTLVKCQRVIENFLSVGTLIVKMVWSYSTTVRISIVVSLTETSVEKRLTIIVLYSYWQNIEAFIRFLNWVREAHR